MNEREYAAATTAAAVADRSDRTLLRLFGRDPARILQGIVTNDVINAPADRAVYAALLTPKGRMVADLRIIRTDSEFLLDVGTAAVPELLALFKRTVPPLFARFEDLGATMHVLGVYGPQAAAALAAVLPGELPSAEDDALRELHHGDERRFVVATRYAGVPGYDVVASNTLTSTLRQQLAERGVVPLDPATLEVLRIEAGVPRWGTELTPETIPLEAGLKERAISTSKGCYTGQEVIIRILHRGHVNRQLRGLLFSSNASAARELVHPESGKVVGQVTSSAQSPRLGQQIGLGYVRREVEPGTILHAGDVAGPRVTVVTLPFAS